MVTTKKYQRVTPLLLLLNNVVTCSMYKNYDGDADYKFLNGMGIEYIHHQPWQIGLFPEEFEGKFVWYPRKGTLMIETDNYTKKLGEYLDTEEMYNAMMEVVKNKLI